MTEREESGEATTFGFVSVHGKSVEAAPAGVRDVVRATCDSTTRPAVVQVEREWRVDANGRMQAGCGLPGAEAHAPNEFTLPPGARQWDAAAVTRDDIPFRCQARHAHL